MIFTRIEKCITRAVGYFIKLIRSMPFLINRNRKVPCKGTQGGLKRVYITAFEPYSRAQYSVLDGELLNFPQTFVQTFELSGSSNSFSERYDGEKYTQTLTLKFPKSDSESNMQMETLNYMEWRIIVQDRNDNYFILGLDNGLTSDGLSVSSGAAHADFNGYDITFSGLEKHRAPSIQDPFTIGFLEAGEIFQFQDLVQFQFQDGEPYQFN